MQSLIKKVQKLEAKTTSVRSSSPGGDGLCDDTALFLAKPGRGKEWHPMKPGIINNKFKSVFLDNVSDHSGTALSSRYKAHSCRHAVASALRDMAVTPAAIAAHAATTPQSLENTYLLPVNRDWQVPMECVTKHAYLACKLLVPYVHYTSARENGGECRCDKLFSV